MYEQVEKPKENKSKAVGNSVAQKKSNVKQGFGFADNRLEVNKVAQLEVMRGKNSRKEKLYNRTEASNLNRSAFDHTIQRVVEVEEKQGSNILRELTRLILTGDPTLEAIDENKDFKLLIMDTAANKKNNDIGGVVDGNALTLYKTKNLITVVVDVEKCGEDMGQALRILSHEVNIHAVNGYKQSQSNEDTATPEELEDHVKILNLKQNQEKNGPIIEHRRNILDNLVKGLYLEDFTNFYTSWRSEINSYGLSSKLIENAWVAALKLEQTKRTDLQNSIVSSLGDSGNMKMIISEAKKAATEVCGAAFEQFLKIAQTNQQKLSEYDLIEIDRLKKVFATGKKNDNPKSSNIETVVRLTREEFIAEQLGKNAYKLNDNIAQLKVCLNINADDPDDKRLSFTLKDKIKFKPAASILVSDKLLQYLKETMLTSTQSRYDVFVTQSEITQIN